MTQLSIVARSAAVRSRFGSAFGPRRRVSAGDAAEDGAGRDLAGGARAGDRVAGRIFDFGVVRDFEAAEGERKR
jgi:hypothetical protein